MIANAGDRAARRFIEFFAASISNDNTRMAYYRAACSFFAWLEQHGIGELVDIEPFHVAAYIKALQSTAAKPTAKQHLAAIRMLFDWLIVGQGNRNQSGPCGARAETRRESRQNAGTDRG